MHRFAPVVRVCLMLALAVVALGMDCAGGGPMDNTNGNGNGNDNTNDGIRLFVVNNAQGITSYVDPATVNGNVAPETDLPAGATTDIFQPRGIAITNNNILIVSRQNGGLTLHDNALTATGDTSADRIVEGNATGLDSPICLAYDAANDRLFVGNASAADGILVFDNVSNAAFNGNVSPSRMFNPPDRSPTNSTEMTIDAMHVDSDGHLWVSDSSGLNVNSSRILVFNNPGTANGQTAPNQTLASIAWGGIEDLFVDDTDHLYVVDDSEEIEVFDNASTQNTVVTPDRTIALSGVNVGLRGIVVDSMGRGYAADSGNSEIAIILNIATRDGAIDADDKLDGSSTGLSAPRHMDLVED